MWRAEVSPNSRSGAARTAPYVKPYDLLLLLSSLPLIVNRCFSNTLIPSTTLHLRDIIKGRFMLAQYALGSNLTQHCCDRVSHLLCWVDQIKTTNATNERKQQSRDKRDRRATKQLSATNGLRQRRVATHSTNETRVARCSPTALTQNPTFTTIIPCHDAFETKPRSRSR